MRKQARRLKRSWELAEIARRKLAGESRFTIGEALGLSPSQVSARLAQLKRQWIEEARVDVERVRAWDLVALDHVERELWDAFEVSQQPRVTIRTTARKGDHPYSRELIEKKTRESSTKIMTVITQAKRLRAHMFCLYPEKAAAPRPSPALEAPPLAHIESDRIFAELERRYGVIEVWAQKPIIPIPGEWPPSFYPPTPAGEDDSAGEE